MGDDIYNQEHVAEQEPTQEERRAEGGGEQGRAPGKDVTPELKARLMRLAEWQERFVAARGLGERLRLLVSFGLSDHDIAKAVPGAGARSVRRWRTEGPPTTRAAQRWEPIDDLCATVGFLLANATYDEEGIVAWLRSRNAALDHQRPLDVLGGGQFEAVRAAAERDVEQVAASDEELFSLRQKAPAGGSRA
ncbi:MAG TPA: hypothetical protein VKB03_14305 [Conexibacter sp.]|nr:hypothetical protein [Conexibacter sp.]